MFTGDQEDNEPFPAGLRVLVVDDDPKTLLPLERLLLACQYRVTKCQRASDALSLLRKNQGSFDIVMSDIHMPGIDGLQLLEIICLEMDLPVVMMSYDNRRDMVMKIVKKGACDYLLKPIRMEEIRVIWQHVVRKRRNNFKPYMLSKFLPFDAQPGHQKNFQANHEDTAIQGIKENNGISNCRNDDKNEGHKDMILSLKKPRMVWTEELHHQFVAVINHMGLHNAVPKKILEAMKVPGLTRENVASHLQKYRLHLRRKNDETQTRLRVATVHLQNVVHPCFGDNRSSQAYAISEQLLCQNSVFPRTDQVLFVGAPLNQQISCYNQRFASELIFETGQQQSWYHETEASNHLPHHDHKTSAMIVESERDSLTAMERLQSSFKMERSDELARNEADNVAAYVNMNSIEDEDAQNESSFGGVNSRDPDYALSSSYDSIFLAEQHNQAALNHVRSSSQLACGHLEVNSIFYPYAY